MSKKIKDMSLSEQHRYYDIFVEHDRSFDYVWAHYRIHHNTMYAIVRNILKGFFEEKEGEFRRLFRK